jgi:uncharacterized membrane protein
MMLQGHFTDTLLDVAYRDPNNLIYSTWLFMRGLTAPVFFFASGLIFVFLLLRDGRPFRQNERVLKGLRRGLSLIVIGYVLRLHFPRLLQFKIYNGLFAVDVLHCIGLALLSLLALYWLSQRLQLSYPLLLGAAGLLFFFFEPTMKSTEWEALPLALRNYFTKDYGSVFTPIPWLGYALLGGVLGAVLHRRPGLAFGQWLPLLLLAGGFLLHAHSSKLLINLYHFTGIHNFYAHAYNNYLLYRLGHVFIAVAAFIWIAQLWKTIPKLLLKIGSETLVIYEVHFILLYSTWFGIGLSRYWYRSLNPWEIFFGAILFELFFVLLVAHIDAIRKLNWAWLKTNAPLAWQWLSAQTVLGWRIARIKTVRWYRRVAYSYSKAE